MHSFGFCLLFLGAALLLSGLLFVLPAANNRARSNESSEERRRQRETYLRQIERSKENARMRIDDPA